MSVGKLTEYLKGSVLMDFIAEEIVLGLVIYFSRKT
jgi:hypothetical protein